MTQCTRQEEGEERDAAAICESACCERGEKATGKHQSGSEPTAHIKPGRAIHNNFYKGRRKDKDTNESLMYSLDCRFICVTATGIVKLSQLHCLGTAYTAYRE